MAAKRPAPFGATHLDTQPALSHLKALGEFKRAPRRGGKLVVPTLCHGVDWHRRLLSALLGVVSPFVAHTKFSPESLRELVASAGFEPAKPIVLPGRFPLAYWSLTSLGRRPRAHVGWAGSYRPFFMPFHRHDRAYGGPRRHGSMPCNALPNSRLAPLGHGVAHSLGGIPKLRVESSSLFAR